MSDVAALQAHLRGDHHGAYDESCRACRDNGPPPAVREEAPSPRPVAVHPCECGCGLPVRRRFAPGHDAKLKSRLKRAAQSPDPMTRIAAVAELERRGW